MGALTDRVAVITGASRGIGRALALGLAREDCHIVVAAKSTESTEKLPGSIYTVAQEVEACGVQALPVQVDVRIVCATNQDLDRMMAEGRFREDLFYRLNEVMVRVPPLRERLGDAVVLASFFLRRFAAEYGRPVRGFASAALTAVKDHPWPGNVRELENRVKRAVVMADGALLSVADLGL